MAAWQLAMGSTVPTHHEGTHIQAVCAGSSMALHSAKNILLYNHNSKSLKKVPL